MRRTETTRRRALAVTGAAAALLLTGGCAEDSAPRGGTEGSAANAVAASARAEARLRKRSARARQTLLTHYDAVIAAHPSAAGRLKPLREAVARQADALRAEGPAGPAPAPPAVATERKAALKELAAEEQRGADAHTAALLEAPAELARLLASVAAAGAAHVYLLTEGSEG